jgi:predicted ferric reductase
MAGWFESASAPVVAGVVWTLTAFALLACWRVTTLKEWARTVDLRWLVLLHVTRFVGLYFFYLCSRGELPFRFAAPAGTGDIVTAMLAVLLLALSGARKWKMLIAWNTIGFTDILFVVFTALRVGLEDWRSMHALREFPLSLLPMFLVPLIIVSHILIFFRAAHLAAKKEQRFSTARV